MEKEPLNNNLCSHGVTIVVQGACSLTCVFATSGPRFIESGSYLVGLGAFGRYSVASILWRLAIALIMSVMSAIGHNRAREAS